MTLWDVTVCDYPPELIGNLFPAEEMLFEYNGPAIFTFKTRWNGIAIAYLSDEDDNILRYVIAPTNQTIVESLKSGIISVRNALDQPVIWLADVTTSDWSISKCWQLQIKDLPEDAIPKLSAEMIPLPVPKSFFTEATGVSKWKAAKKNGLKQCFIRGGRG